ASALRELCELLHIDMSSVVAVGDSLNDIAAIRERQARSASYVSCFTLICLRLSR
ncbi:HAD hydrolase family protein, partial [Paenibacillus sp. MCAF20]